MNVGFLFTSKSKQPKGRVRKNVHCPILLLLVLVLSAQPVFADTSEKAADVGLGIASFVSTLPYGAVKLAYAGLGAIVGGFTYLLTAGDLDSANVVWEKSLLGTYVITPDHLTGDKQVRFLGP